MSRAGVFRSALLAERPFEELCRTAAALVQQGRQRIAVIGELHELIIALQIEGHDEAAPAILGVIDRLGGWCRPEMRI